MARKSLLSILELKLHGQRAKEKEVLIETTAQDKNITFPTDSKLHKRLLKKGCN